MFSDKDALLKPTMHWSLSGSFRLGTCTGKWKDFPFIYVMIFLLNLQGDTDEDVPAGGFHMGLLEKGRSTSGPGFSLKFWPSFNMTVVNTQLV